MAKSGARVDKVAGRGSAAGDDTRTRIVEAALETLKREGILGTSARAIARTGGFNQALIFYHFGSVNDVLLAAVDRTSATRMARYRERLVGLTSLPELAGVAAELYEEDRRDGTITVLSQLLASAASTPGLGPELLARFGPWMELVRSALHQVVADTPVATIVPFDDLAYAVTALFVGIELLSQLDPEPVADSGAPVTADGRSASLFQAIGILALLLDGVLRSGLLPPPAGLATPTQGEDLTS